MRRLCCLALAFLLVAPSGLQDDAALTRASRTLDVRLPNGLHVVIVPDDLAPVVTTVISYGAGSDEEQKPGEAHAVEHMMFRGTSDISANQFADLTARMDAEYDADTSNERTEYYFTVPSCYLGIVLHIEADRMRNATISAPDWEVERGAIEQEVRGNESSPYFSLQQKIRDILFAGTPYEHTALGTVQSFQSITATDLRNFYEAWYHPNNATLVIAGDVDPSIALHQVQAEFGKIPAAQLPRRPSASLKPLQAQSIDGTLYVPIGSVGFAFRYPGLNSSDYPAAQILISALNDPRGALADLAASGKVFGAGASTSMTPSFSTAWINEGVRADADMSAALTTLQQTLAQIAAQGIPADAVNDAKRKLLNQRAFDLTSISGTAFAWSNALALGLQNPEALRAAYARVTTADVNRVLRTYLVTADRLTVRVTPGRATGQQSFTTGGGENVALPNPEPVPLPAWAESAFVRPIPAPQEPPDTRTCALPNGLRAIVTSTHVAPVVVLDGDIEYNQTLYAPHGHQGVADITNQLMSWGTTTLDRKAFAAAVQAIPATVYAGTSFGLGVQAQNFDRALTLLADNLLHPRLPESAFKVIQRNGESVLARGQQRSPYRALLAMQAALYPIGDPFRRHVTADSLRSVTLDDVHEWYLHAFRPDETRIAIVGDLPPGYVCRELARHFDRWQNIGPQPKFGYQMVPLNRAATASVPSLTAAQTTVQLGEIIPIHLWNPDRYALQLADTILAGEGAASLLFQDLRARHGYVYNVSSNLDVGHQRSAYWFTFAADPKNAAAAQRALLSDIRNLQRNDVSNATLTQAKDTWLAQSELARDSYAGLASELLTSVWFPGNIKRNVGTDWNAVLSVTPEQVREAMAKWVRADDFVSVSIVPEASLVSSQHPKQ
jgi:zinc protease